MDSLGKGLPACRAGRSGRRSHTQWIAVAALVASIAFPALAAEPADSTPEPAAVAASNAAPVAIPPEVLSTIRPLPRQLLYDVKDLTTAPLRWRASQWARFGGGAALVYAIYLNDQRIFDAVQRNRHHATDEYFRAVTHLGGGYGEDLAFALIGGGALFRNPRVMNSGIDALESSVWAAGVVTPAIKDVVGRARPNMNEGAHSFHGFTNRNGWESFPSGHSTNAFALATAIAADYADVPYVRAIAYTLATSVAVARVNEGVHFPSDVVAGALIGHAVAKSVTNNHRAVKVTIMPQRNGFMAHVTF